MDDMEDKLVSEFMRSECGCTKDKGKPMFQLFSPEYGKLASCYPPSHFQYYLIRRAEW
jgi:hypothetical protein